MIRITAGPRTPSPRGPSAPRPGRSPRPPRPPGASPRTRERNTRAAYRCALRQFDTWRGAAPATDATLAAYLGWLFEQGRAPATAALGVAAVTFRATLAGTPVRGPQTDRVLAGFRRDGADGAGAGRPRPCAPTASPPSSPPPTAPASRAGAAKRTPSPSAAARSTRRSPRCSSRAGSAARRRRSSGATWRRPPRGRDPRHRASLENRPGGDRRRRALSQERRRSRGPGPPPRRRRADRPRLWRPDAPAARAPLHRRRRRRRAPRAAHRAQRPGGAGLGTHRARRVHHRRDARRGVETARMVAHYSAGATAELGAVARYL